jgi:hypothetical protein
LAAFGINGLGWMLAQNLDFKELAWRLGATALGRYLSFIVTLVVKQSNRNYAFDKPAIFC